MARTHLVPLNGSPLSFAALRYVLEVHPDDSIVALHVIDPTEPGYSTTTEVDVTEEPLHGSPEWYERAHGEEAQVFEEAESMAAEYGVTIKTDQTIGDPADAIVRYTEEQEIDHIVMGSHGRESTSRLLLGSVAELVVRRAPVPVTVYRDEERY